MTSNDLLARAVHDLRLQADGFVVDPASARARVLAGVVRRQARWRRAMVMGLVLAGLVSVPPVWAAATGRLPQLWRALIGAAPLFQASRPEKPRPPARSDTSVPTPAVVPALVPVISAPATPPDPIRPAALETRPGPRQDGPRVTPRRPVAAGEGAVEPKREAALFRAAFRRHFEANDARAALEGWDAYLRFSPDGRFALEATYNRAICLARLGRDADAIEALTPFADGEHGDYRRAEARRLIAALTRRDAP